MKCSFKKVLIAGCATVGISTMASAGDFNLGGFIETGYVYQKTGDTKNATFHAREASIHAAGKVGDVDGKVQLGYGLADQNTFYMGVNAGAYAYGVSVDQAYVTFHPSFLGEDGYWRWGKYDGPFGYEGAYATNNTFLSRSFNFSLNPTQVTGTALGKNFGMFTAELQVTNTTSIAGAADSDFNTVANSSRPAFIIGLGFGSKDSMYLDAHFGLGKENTENSMLIDVAAGGMFQALTYGLNFTLAKEGTPKAWGISVMGDYKFNDDMGFGLRFDYAGVDTGMTFAGTAHLADVKYLGLAPALHYAINKNVTAKFEYHMVKPDSDGAEVMHTVAWAAVLGF